MNVLKQLLKATLALATVLAIAILTATLLITLGPLLPELIQLILP